MPRRAWICLLIFCLPTCLCGLVGVDSWPFSSFPMYSVALNQPRFEDYSVHLVTVEGCERPVLVAQHGEAAPPAAEGGPLWLVVEEGAALVFPEPGRRPDP